MSVSEILLLGLIYTCIGVFSGLVAGILGIGGGVIVVPGLLFILQYTQLVPAEAALHVAAGTSLAVMIFTSHAAFLVHHKLGTIAWADFNTMWPGILCGVLLGGILANYIPTDWLEIFFGLFLLFVAYKLITSTYRVRPKQYPKAWIHRLVTLGIGLQSGLLGVGGGVLIIPYLTYCGIAVRNIAPVSNLCSFVVGLIGALLFMLSGQQVMASVSYSTGYVYWPAVALIAIPSSLVAPIGAKLSYVLPVKQLKYAFMVILIATSIKMLV